MDIKNNLENYNDELENIDAWVYDLLIEIYSKIKVSNVALSSEELSEFKNRAESSLDYLFERTRLVNLRLSRLEAVHYKHLIKKNLEEMILKRNELKSLKIIINDVKTLIKIIELQIGFNNNNKIFKSLN